MVLHGVTVSCMALQAVEKILVTVREAAIMLSICEREAWKLIKNGTLPQVSPSTGRKLTRVRVADVRRYADELGEPEMRALLKHNED